MLRVTAYIEEPALVARIPGHFQQRLEPDDKLARARQRFRFLLAFSGSATILSDNSGHKEVSPCRLSMN
jgi:hypothetical protein